MMRPWFILGAAVAAPLIALLPPLGAGSSPGDPFVRVTVEIPPVEFHLVASASTTIAHGRITRRESVFPVRGVGYTSYTMRVIDTWKGAPAEEHSFGVLGTIDGRVTLVGAPRFEIGDEIVALLHTDAAGQTGLLGLQHGVRRVVRRDDAPFYRDPRLDRLVPLPELRAQATAAADPSEGRDR